MPSWLEGLVLLGLIPAAGPEGAPPASVERPLAGERRGAACLAALEDVVAVGGHGGVDLLQAGKRTSLGPKRNTLALLFQGELLLEAGGLAGEKGEVLCWEWRKGKLLWSVEAHQDLAASLAVAGGWVWSGGADKQVVVLDLASGRVEERLSGHAGAVLALAASPDGKLVVSAGTDRSLRVWEGPGRKLLRTIQNHGEAVHALAWSPDGSYLASGSADRTVRIWQPAIGRLVRIVRGHEGTVLALAFHGGRLVSGSTDGRVRIIDPESDAVLKTLTGHADWVVGLAASKDGLLSADWTGKVLLWKEEGPETLEP